MVESPWSGPCSPDGAPLPMDMYAHETIVAKKVVKKKEDEEEAVSFVVSNTMRFGLDTDLSVFLIGAKSVRNPSYNLNNSIRSKVLNFFFHSRLVHFCAFYTNDCFFEMICGLLFY